MFVYFFGLLCFLSAASFSEAVTCYHCFDAYNKTVSLISSDGTDFGSAFVRCDKNKLKWNSWECPAKWPVCVIMSGTVQDHYEVVRTCGERGICSRYVPPLGVKVDSCRECETHLCNDYTSLPDPPLEPMFTFNININLNLKKYPLLSGEGSEESDEADD